MAPGSTQPLTEMSKEKVKVKQSHYRSRGCQEVEAPRFQDNRHMKVVRLSALCTGRLYPPGNIPGTHFCGAWGGVVVKGTALLVGESRDRSPVTGDFFRGIRQFHVPWGRLSL